MASFDVSVETSVLAWASTGTFRVLSFPDSQRNRFVRTLACGSPSPRVLRWGPGPCLFSLFKLAHMGASCNNWDLILGSGSTCHHFTSGFSMDLRSCPCCVRNRIVKGAHCSAPSRMFLYRAEYVCFRQRAF